VATIGQWFELHGSTGSYAEGLSQFNGYAVWFRLDNWHSWFKGYFSDFLINSTGRVNYLGVGTVMHEVLHKQAVSGGFTHDQMNTAIKAVFSSLPTAGSYNVESVGLGNACFSSLK
jgi:hypothetical protein